MTKDYRKFCSIHHYLYKGNECPFCFQERIKKYNVTKEVKKKEKKSDKEISEEMLKKLVDKYKK